MTEFQFSPRELRGQRAFRRFLAAGDCSENFVRAFQKIQEEPLKDRWRSIVSILIPAVTDPNDCAQAFLVCNALRHIPKQGSDLDKKAKGDQNEGISLSLSVQKYRAKLGEHKRVYRDFRYFAFNKVEKMFPGTVLAEMCRIITEPHPDLMDGGGTSLFSLDNSI